MEQRKVFFFLPLAGKLFFSGSISSVGGDASEGECRDSCKVASTGYQQRHKFIVGCVAEGDDLINGTSQQILFANWIRKTSIGRSADVLVRLRMRVHVWWEKFFRFLKFSWFLFSSIFQDTFRFALFGFLDFLLKFFYLNFMMFSIINVFASILWIFFLNFFSFLIFHNFSKLRW